MLEEGVGNLKDKLPVLLILNKKDLIKPGEIAKRLEVSVLKLFRPYMACRQAVCDPCAVRCIDSILKQSIVIIITNCTIET